MFPDFNFPFSICSRLSQQRTLMARIQRSCNRESPASRNRAAASGTSSVHLVINPISSN